MGVTLGGSISERKDPLGKSAGKVPAPAEYRQIKDKGVRFNEWRRWSVDSQAGEGMLVLGMKGGSLEGINVLTFPFSL